MILETMVVGEFAANCYIVGCERTKKAMVIDPGGDAGRIWSAVKAAGLELVMIVNTHGHVDHIAGNAELKRLSGAEIVIHEADQDMLTNPARNLSILTPVPVRPVPADRTVADGDVIAVGDLAFAVIHTPGHTPGGMTLAGHGVAFTGDTLFAGSIGRTDFPGGSYELIIHSIEGLVESLSEDTRVLPGHGPESTIRDEQRHNPFLGA